MADNQNTQELLLQLGLDDKEVTVYQCLVNSSIPLSILDISKRTDIARSSIYRVIDDLITKGFVKKSYDQDQSEEYIGVPYSELHHLILQKQAELDAISGLVEKLARIESSSESDLVVQKYTGQKGLHQMMSTASDNTNTLNIYCSSELSEQDVLSRKLREKLEQTTIEIEIEQTSSSLGLVVLNEDTLFLGQNSVEDFIGIEVKSPNIVSIMKSILL